MRIKINQQNPDFKRNPGVVSNMCILLCGGRGTKKWGLLIRQLNLFGELQDERTCLKKNKRWFYFFLVTFIFDLMLLVYIRSMKREDEICFCLLIFVFLEKKKTSWHDKVYFFSSIEETMRFLFLSFVEYYDFSDIK